MSHVLLIESTKMYTDAISGENLLNCSLYSHPSLGLLSIYNFLKEQGYDVEYLTSSIMLDPVKYLVELLKQKQFDYIGISTTSYTIEKDAYLAFVAKTVQPNTKIVMGGYYAWLFPENTLKYTDADFVIRGHGEYPLLELITLSSGNITNNRLKKIEGLCFKYYDKKIGAEKYIISEPFYLTKEMIDKLPISFDKNINKQYKNSRGYIYTSFGCPFKCSFCTVHKLYPKMIFKDIEKAMSEIKILVHSGKNKIFIVDPDINVNKKHFVNLCNAIIEEKNANGIPKNISFNCQVRLDLFDDEMLLLAKKAGFRYLLFGVESLNKNLRKEDFNKGGKLAEYSSAEVIEKLNHIKKFGLKPYVYFILGSPNANLKTVKESMDYICASRCGNCEFNVFIAAFPETDIAKEYINAENLVKSNTKFLRHKNNFIDVNLLEMPTTVLPKDKELAALLDKLCEDTNAKVLKTKQNFQNCFIKVYKENTI